MASIQLIQTALQALRKAAVEGKAKKSVVESIDNVTSSVILLNSSSPSPLTFEKLASVLRVPLVPLYANYTDHTLAAASAILNFLLNNGILPCLLRGGNQYTERQVGWERVTHSLLSGIIDFLENSNNDKAKTSVSKALYTPICEFFFREESSEGSIGATLRCTAYMLLSDSAALHHDNQSKLRDHKFLGAQALGLTISRTRDFAVLEALLNVFAILLPSSSVPQKRSSYIQGVFCDCGQEILDLLDTMSSRDWDETAAKVIDILAASDISFPQPFNVDEVVVCDVKYPQPEASDRFYIDRKSFFVNVRREDGLYEDLQIKYNTIDQVSFASTNGDTVLVTMKLKIAPKLGERTIAGSATLLVRIINSDVPRFKKALQHRSLNRAIVASRQARISLSEHLMLDENGQTPASSPSQKTKKVEKFYEVDQREIRNDEQNAVDSHVALNKVTTFPTTVTTPSAVPDAPGNPKQEASLAKLNATVFGGTDEELSDMNEIEQVPAHSKGRIPKEGDRSPQSVTEVIVLSDNSDSEPAPAAKASVLTSRPARKRQPRRVESNDGETIGVRSGDADNLAKGGRSKNALSVTSASEMSQSPDSEGKLSAKRMPLTAKISEPVAPSTRPLQDVIVTVSKLPAGSDDDDAATDPQDAQVLSPDVGNGTEQTADRDYANDPVTVDGPSPKAAPSARKSEQMRLSTRIPLSPDPRSSSPTSKIARMKAKKQPGKDKPIKPSTRKRAADKDSSENPRAFSRKRPRVDAEIQVHEDGVVNTSTPKKRGRPRRKANAAGPQKAEVEQDRPSAKNVDKPSQEKSGPAQRNPLAKADLKKESLKKSEDVSEKPTNTSKNETKVQMRSRVALQTIPDTSNRDRGACVKDTLLTISPAGNVNLHQPGGTVPSDQWNVVPSLEDILLKGAQVQMQKCPTPRKTTAQPSTESANIPRNSVNDYAVGRASTPVMDNDVRNHIDTGVFNGAREGEYPADPHTPSPKLEKTAPLPRAPGEDPSKRTFEFDTEAFDLTDEDIREVLQNLRARKTKKLRELESSTRPQIPTRKMPTVEEEEFSCGNIYERAVQEVSRPKVQFDDTLRYKSASLESLPVRGTEGAPLSRTMRMHRLSESESAPRGPVAASGTNRKQKASQSNKEPGLEEIIHVLDAIQNVVVSNITNKSRTVRSDIRAARDRLIREAATDLLEMREESIGHYNNLLALENEYANVNRKLNVGFENVANINDDICKFVGHLLNVHDRGSLSKKMTQSLFPAALPTSFQKFT